MATKRIVTQNLVFTINNSNIKDFANKIDDITRIDNQVIMTISKENILIYTVAGESKINAFKSHIIKTDQYFEGIKELEDEVKFIISDAKKFYKTISHFKDFEDDVKCKIVYNEDGMGEKILLKNSKLKLEVYGTLGKFQKVSLEDIEKNMDIEKANFNFKMLDVDFDKIKKLSQIDKENEYYNIIIKENKVIIGEKSWTLELDEIEAPNDTLSFPKKYFNTIKMDNEKINIYVYNNFILIMNDDTNLMITTEFRI
jgi:hypothetical protein